MVVECKRRNQQSKSGFVECQFERQWRAKKNDEILTMLLGIVLDIKLEGSKRSISAWSIKMINVNIKIVSSYLSAYAW